MTLPHRQDGFIVHDTQWNAHADAINANTNAVGNLDGRVSTNEADVSNLQGRMSTAEGDITSNDGDISSLDSRVTALENDSGGGGGSFGAWQTPAYESGWSDDSTMPLRFRTIPGNRVEVVGSALIGASAGEWAFTLPAAYRPTSFFVVPSMNGAKKLLPISVYAAGQLYVYGVAEGDSVPMFFTFPLDL